MPVKRRVPKRRREPVPAWAERLVAGEMPERDGPDWAEWLEWVYLGAEIAGLPMADSAEGRRLWAGKLLCL